MLLVSASCAYSCSNDFVLLFQKLDPGTDDYDTSKKQRVPSWTDRVSALPGATVLHPFSRVTEQDRCILLLLP